MVDVPGTSAAGGFIYNASGWLNINKEKKMKRTKVRIQSPVLFPAILLSSQFTPKLMRFLDLCPKAIASSLDTVVKLPS